MSISVESSTFIIEFEIDICHFEYLLLQIAYFVMYEWNKFMMIISNGWNSIESKMMIVWNRHEIWNAIRKMYKLHASYLRYLYRTMVQMSNW